MKMSAKERILEILNEKREEIEKRLREELNMLLSDTIPAALRSKLPLEVKLGSYNFNPPHASSVIDISEEKAKELLKNWEIYYRNRQQEEIDVSSPPIAAEYIIFSTPHAPFPQHLEIIVKMEIRAIVKIPFTPALKQNKKYPIIGESIKLKLLYLTSFIEIESFSPRSQKAIVFVPSTLFSAQQSPTSITSIQLNESVIGKIAEGIMTFVSATCHPAGVTQLVHLILEDFTKIVNRELEKYSRHIYLIKKETKIKVKAHNGEPPKIEWEIPLVVEINKLDVKKKTSVRLVLTDVADKHLEVTMQVGGLDEYTCFFHPQTRGGQPVLIYYSQLFFSPDFVREIVGYLRHL